MSHTEIASSRGCYCGLWDTKPEVLRDQGLAEGFCGKCMTCGEPGHTRHFPGPVPFTGSWCDRHYRLLHFTDPRTMLGWLPWVLLIGFIAYTIWAALNRR